MTMQRHLKTLLAAAALCAAAASHAAGVQADIALGETLSRGTTDGDHNAGVWGASLGYRFDGNWAVQATSFGQFDLFRNFLADESTARYGFDRFIGVQALGYLPLSDAFELRGGLGIGHSKLNNGFVDSPDRTNTDGLLSAGLQWHVVRHFDIGFDINYLTKTEVSTAMVRTQWAF
jgi:hypothetical protein